MILKKVSLLILWILPFLVILILLSSSFQMWSDAQNLSYELLRSESNNAAEQIKTRLELFLFEREKDLDHLGSLKKRYSLPDFLERFRTDAAGIISREKNYYAISFVDTNARVLVRTGLDTIPSLLYKLDLTGYLEKLAIDAEAILTSVKISADSLLLVILIPVFIESTRKSEFVGAVAASLWEQTVIENIVSLSVNKTSYVVIYMGETLLYENWVKQTTSGMKFSKKVQSALSFQAMQQVITVSVHPPEGGLLGKLTKQNKTWLISNGIASIIVTSLLSLALLISNRLRIATTELARSEERYRHLAENASDMIFQQSIPQGNYEYVSPAAERLTGYKPEEYYYTPFLFEKILVPGDLTRYRDLWHQVLNGKSPQTLEFSIIHKSGELRWINQRNSLMFKGGMLVAVEGILTDITEQKKAAFEREKLIKELEEKNRDLERFTYIISHELKTPLITIKGFLGYLEDEAVKGDFSGFHQDVLRIVGATETMGRLLNDLIILNRIGRESSEKQLIELNKIVQQTIRNYSGKIKEKSIRIIVSERLPEVKGYPDELMELFRNLIDNSIKFTENRQNPFIEIGVTVSGNEQVIYIKDNGSGFESRYSERIFGMFNKLDNATTGTGAGLTLSRRIVEHHGGWIRAQSDGPGKGAIVFFTLPS